MWLSNETWWALSNMEEEVVRSEAWENAVFQISSEYCLTLLQY